MTFSVGPIEIFQDNKSLVTCICSGPGGLVIACLSIAKNHITNVLEDNLSIWTINDGLQKVGTIKLSSCHRHIKLNGYLDHHSRILWHPSGENIAIIVGGNLYFIGIQWSIRGSAKRMHFNDVVLLHSSDRYGSVGSSGNGVSFAMNDNDIFKEVIVTLECYKTLNIMASTLCATNNGKEIAVGTANAQLRRFTWKGRISKCINFQMIIFYTEQVSQLMLPCQQYVRIEMNLFKMMNYMTTLATMIMSQTKTLALNMG